MLVSHFPIIYRRLKEDSGRFAWINSWCTTSTCMISLHVVLYNAIHWDMWVRARVLFLFTVLRSFRLCIFSTVFLFLFSWVVMCVKARSTYETLLWSHRWFMTYIFVCVYVYARLLPCSLMECTRPIMQLEKICSANHILKKFDQCTFHFCFCFIRFKSTLIFIIMLKSDYYVLKFITINCHWNGRRRQRRNRTSVQKLQKRNWCELNFHT